MAYGLTTINRLYTGDGSGRDWFFLGSFDYKNGRRTPQANHMPPEMIAPLTKSRGAPAEVKAGNAKTEGRRSTKKDKWMKRSGQFTTEVVDFEKSASSTIKSESGMKKSSTEPALLSSLKAGASPGSTTLKGSSQPRRGTRRAPRGDGCVTEDQWTTTYNTHGQVPGFSENRYHLPVAVENKQIGLSRKPYNSLDYGSGDHRTNITSSKPHFTTDMNGNLGCAYELPDTFFSGRRHEVEVCQQLRDGKVHEADDKIKSQEGDLCRGIKGKTDHFTSDMMRLGSFYKPADDKQLPAKHHFSAHPTFFDKSDLKAKKAIEGDECLGIKTGQPHFRTTSSDLGNIPGWQKSHYNFGALATKNYRFTVWRE
eukprot:TRINITY_DN3967_c2_g3_i1.p1 TRINITY_DN3967_c2_g3~~TRINITY_DN3967_c2_g3_i1.p1  ORF type:complete len:367 (+),score=59.07 TRINITY_DN3967_c2_g3_i1:36-1136(+)